MNIDTKWVLKSGPTMEVYKLFAENTLEIEIVREFSFDVA